MSDTYFHCAPITLGAGSIIEPGNWGRILNLYESTNGQINQNAVNEALLEWARKALTPTKPSRLNSIFTLPTLADAISFRNRHQRNGVIHEVRLTDDDANRHYGDYEVAITPHQARYFKTMLDFPKRYWTDYPSANHEILFECSAVVVNLPSIPPV